MSEVPASVDELTMLSMIMPLVPPASAKAAVAITPTFVHITVPSTVIPPGVSLNTGTVPPEVPANVTNWMLLALSRISARAPYGWPATQVAGVKAVIAEMGSPTMKDMGTVMKNVMARFAAAGMRVDGKVVQRVRVGPVSSVNEFDALVAHLAAIGFPGTRLATE